MKLISKLCFLFLFSYSFLYGGENTNLLEFARIGNLDGVKKSLSGKADINFKDSLGTSALMFAANYDHFQVVKYLVDNQADVIAKNTNGWTAAVMAGARGNTFIKDYLEKVEQKIIKSRATGIVLHLVGEAYVENRRLQVGDRILENQTLYVGKKSICDIQIKQSLSEFTLRLKEESLLSLKFKEAPNENIFSGFVKMGSVIFKIEKVFSGEKIQAVTPTSVASVIGTLYEVKVEKDGSTKIIVYDGVVRTRVRDPNIEDDEVIENTPEIKKLISNLDNNSQTVSSGQSLDVSKKKQHEILKKADVDGLKKRAMRSEFSTEPIPDLSLTNSEKLELKSIKPSELLANQKESEDLIAIEAAKLKNASETPEILLLIQRRKEEKAISGLQSGLPKQPVGILFKNGQFLTGSVYQIGRKYIVFSTLGKQVFDETEVEGFIFE